MNKKLFCSICIMIFLLFTQAGSAQQLDKLNQSFRFQDQCFDIRIKTIKLHKTGNILADPIIKLNTSESVTLCFDEIDMANENYRNYFYTIQHVDADWLDEGLIANDYMSGFPENPLDDYQQSMTTGVGYTNYSLTVPNDHVRLKISGNYLIKVYESSSRKPVLQKGFSVFEPGVHITSTVRQESSNPSAFQQLEFSVNHNIVKVNDAFRNLKVRIKQNSITLFAEDPMPVFTQPNETDYSRPDKNIFPGINEFRTFDTRKLSYNAQGVGSIYIKEGLYHTILNEDYSRADERFSSYKDADGKYVIDAERISNPSIEADYTNVHFALKTSKIGGRVFILGELSNWSLQDEFEMQYDQEQGRYTNDVLLKQGYYNYRYVVLNAKEKNESLDMTSLEGNYFDTENSYSIYVYFRGPSDRFDRLVGLDQIKVN